MTVAAPPRLLRTLMLRGADGVDGAMKTGMEVRVAALEPAAFVALTSTL